MLCVYVWVGESAFSCSDSMRWKILLWFEVVSGRKRRVTVALRKSCWWFDSDSDEFVTTTMIVVQTKLYSFRFDCRIVSFTAANTNLMFSVSKSFIQKGKYVSHELRRSLSNSLDSFQESASLTLRVVTLTCKTHTSNNHAKIFPSQLIYFLMLNET